MPDVAPHALRGRLGPWRPTAGVWARRSGSWREAQAVYGKRGGVWKMVWVLTPSVATGVTLTPGAAGSGAATITWTLPPGSNVDEWSVGYTTAAGAFTELARVAKTVTSFGPFTTLSGRQVRATVKGVKYAQIGDAASSALTAIPPTPPTGVSVARVGYVAGRITWSASAAPSTVVRYHVYMNGTEVATTTSPGYYDYRGSYGVMNSMQVSAEGEGGGNSGWVSGNVDLAALTNTLVLVSENYSVLNWQVYGPSFTSQHQVFVNNGYVGPLGGQSPAWSQGTNQMTCYETFFRALDAYGDYIDSNHVRRQTGRPETGGTGDWWWPGLFQNQAYDCWRNENTAFGVPQNVVVNTIGHQSSAPVSHWCDNSGAVGRYVDIYHNGGSFRHADHFAGSIDEQISVYCPAGTFCGLGFNGGGWSVRAGSVHSTGQWWAKGTINTVVPAVPNSAC